MIRKMKKWIALCVVILLCTGILSDGNGVAYALQNVPLNDTQESETKKVTIQYYGKFGEEYRMLYLPEERELEGDTIQINQVSGNWSLDHILVNDMPVEMEQDNQIILQDTESTVKIYYVPDTTYQRDYNCKFYDYTLKAGCLNWGGTKWLGKNRHENKDGDSFWHKQLISINMDECYQGSYGDPVNRLCSGEWNSNGWEYAEHNYTSLTNNSSYNWKINGLEANFYTGGPTPVTGLLDGLSEKGEPMFHYADPGFFVDEDKGITKINSDTGKAETRYVRDYIDNYQLQFLQQGDTYELQNVYRENESEPVAVAGDAFFPMDKYEMKDYEYSTNVSSGDTSRKRNFFFGMRYDVAFSLGNYVGPLDYTFTGDDDMWVVLSEKNADSFTNSHVVLDLGGIHSAATGTADLWASLIGKSDYTLEDQKAFLENHSDTVYQITVLYMERGAEASNCQMNFTIPSANIVTVIPVSKANLTFHKINSEGTPVQGTEFGLYDQPKDGNLLQQCTSDANGNVTFKRLDVGKDYYVKELSTPEGYLLDDTTWQVVVSAAEEGGKASAILTDSKGNEVTKIVNKIDKSEIERKKAANVEDYEQRIYKIDLQVDSPVSQTGAQMKDEVDHCFYMIDPTTKQALPDGATYDGGTVHVDENNDYTIIWENQNVKAWNHSIWIKAKEDFMGGNVITTNKEDSGVTIEDEFLPFNQPSVHVKLLSLTQNEKEITIWKNSKVDPRKLLSEFYQEKTPKIQQLVKDEKDSYILMDIPQSCALTQEEWNSFVSGNSVVKDYSYEGTNEIVGKFVYSRVCEKGNSSFEQHEVSQVGKHVEQYQYRVVYQPLDRGDASSEQPGEKVTEDVTSISNYWINVIDINLVLSKYDSDSKTPLKGAVFQIYQKMDNDNFVKVGDELTSDEKGRMEIELSSPGVYRIEEVKAPKGYQGLEEPIDFSIQAADSFPIQGQMANNSYQPGITVSKGASICDHPDMEQKFCYQIEMDIENTKLKQLPEFGGSGVIWFTIGGAAILFAAGLLLINNKRKEWK